MSGEVMIYNENCLIGIRNRLSPGSVQLTVTSPPFEELFTYSGKPEDVGNNGTSIDVKAGRFAIDLRFTAETLYWVHESGTNCCIHIQQLLAYRIQHGFIGRRDFRGAVIDIWRSAGWDFYGEAAIVKNPQTIAQRQNLYCLQFKTGHSRTSRDLAPAPNDYLLIFKKPGVAKEPVRCLRHAKNPGGWVTEKEWINWAHGCWTDIDQMDVIGGWQLGRESENEKHVCPLQLEVIRRPVLLYTNPGELVLDPFMGIGSTAYVAARNGRQAVGFELKESYHRQALRNAARGVRESGSTESSDLFANVGADADGTD